MNLRITINLLSWGIFLVFIHHLTIGPISNQEVVSIKLQKAPNIAAIKKENKDIRGLRI